MRSIGMLSMQKKPSSSIAFRAVDFPEPDNPVITRMKACFMGPFHLLFE
jgi:hypothetical protein